MQHAHKQRRLSPMSAERTAQANCANPDELCNHDSCIEIASTTRRAMCSALGATLRSGSFWGFARCGRTGREIRRCRSGTPARLEVPAPLSLGRATTRWELGACITDSQAPERMDEMLGKDFEAGLASLRALAEAEAAKSAARAEH